MALKRIKSEESSLQRRSEQEEQFAGWGRRDVAVGSSGQWEKERKWGPVFSDCAGCFCGKENASGAWEQVGWTGLLGQIVGLGLCTIFFLSDSFSFSISIFLF